MLAANHSMNRAPREYQARITGFPYDVVDNVWSMEWWWENIWFDGFKAGQCMLQEAKGNFTRMFDEDENPEPWFAPRLRKFRDDIARQAAVVNPNPPATLTWYFQTPAMCTALADTLEQYSVAFVVEP